MTGTSVSPSLRAAARRPWPAMMPWLAIHQDRVGPAELDDAGRELGDLRLGMRARIAGEGDQRLDLPVLDVQGLGHGMQKPATVGGS
jgi:hypothetical protein